MIREMEKIKTLEEYELAKKDLNYYLNEYKWISETENPKAELEEKIMGWNDQLHEGMDADEELDLLEKIHTFKTKYISIVRGKYKPALRKNITGLVLMMEQFEAANQDISFWELAKGLVKGNKEAKEHFRKKYLFTFANLYGTVPAPESLNVESMDDILEYMAKNYELVDIDLGDRNIENEEMGLIPFEEPLTGIKAKVLDMENRKTEEYINEFSKSSTSQEMQEDFKNKKDDGKIRVRDGFNKHIDNNQKDEIPSNNDIEIE